MTDLTGFDPRGRENLQELKRLLEIGRIADLLALSAKNDPFYMGSPAQMAMAEWFKEVWEDYGHEGDHLRRLHYRIYDQQLITTVKDRMYVNDKVSWEYLQTSSRIARAIGLVTVQEIVDQRNDTPKMFLNERDSEPETKAQWDDHWDRPDHEVFGYDWLPTASGLVIPSAPRVSGYDYDPADQPVRVEVWIEKSTQNDWLVPLCERLHVNLTVGTGYQSIPAAVGILERAKESERPVRVLYISDWDRAGAKMPVSTSRWVEFFFKDFHDVDIAVKRLALTKRQVERYKLPSAPDKPSVELDALEVYQPGALQRLVQHAVEEWGDVDRKDHKGLEDRLNDAEAEAQVAVDEAWNSETDAVKATADALRKEAREFLDSVKPWFDAARQVFEEDFDPIIDRWNSEVIDVLEEAGDNLKVDLPERPEGEVPKVRMRSWLFWTARDYLTQMQAYKTDQATHPAQSEKESNDS